MLQFTARADCESPSYHPGVRALSARALDKKTKKKGGREGGEDEVNILSLALSVGCVVVVVSYLPGAERAGKK